MADSYQISLGIGSPASITRFTLFGLSTSVSGIIQGSLPERYHLAGTLQDRHHLTADLPERYHLAGTLLERDE